ncbi:hypothetical protein [Lutibacter sp.]|uniref:hypothetical protein n=1 Tax=Lutibacter sp. TaxID=1925666 RepID=UPI003563FC68
MKLKLILFLNFIFNSFTSCSQEVNLLISDKQWKEDLIFLKEKVEKTFPSFQNSIHKNEFERIFNETLSSDIQTIEKRVYALQRVLNTLNDEGCNIPLFQEGLDLQVLPIKPYWFNDGMYILDASTDYREFIGKKITKINGFSLEEVFEKTNNYLNADNDYYRSYLFQVYGFMPSLLKTIGLSEFTDQVVLELNSEEQITMKAASISEYSKLDRKLPNDGYFNVKNKSYKGKNYWFELIPNTKTLFVQLQQIVNDKKDNSFSKFVDTIEKLINTNKAEKLIIDIRYGGGGNGFKLKGFTDLLKSSKNINQKGKLFVLTSKATRGTLLELASILNQNTKAILVGEPTAEGVNTVGDITYITLPNSGLKASLTHTFWATSWKQDNSTYLNPEIKVNYQYSDYKENIDTWLTAVENCKLNSDQQQIPKEIAKQLEGTYKINGRKIAINTQGEQLFLTMNRKMKSFFEIKTELYFQSEGIISTDIKNVYLKYINNNGKINLNSLVWKKLELEIQ